MEWGGVRGGMIEGQCLLGRGVEVGVKWETRDPFREAVQGGDGEDRYQGALHFKLRATNLS